MTIERFQHWSFALLGGLVIVALVTAFKARSDLAKAIAGNVIAKAAS